MAVDLPYSVHSAYEATWAFMGLLGSVGYLMYPCLLILFQYFTYRSKRKGASKVRGVGKDHARAEKCYLNTEASTTSDGSAGTEEDCLPEWFYQLCFAFSRIVVYAVRLSLKLFWKQYAYMFNDPCRKIRSFDGYRVHEGINLDRQIRYSDVHQVETFDMMHPTEEFAHLSQGKLPIVYIHGGAFVAVSSELEMFSLGFLVRSGYSVYSLDYPLAPENKYPGALLSILRAMAYLKKNHNLDRIILMGDSAGASLAGMAAAMIENRPLLEELASATGEPLLDMVFPEIETSVLVYGVMDTKSSLVGASIPVRIGLKFVYDAYAPRPGSPLQDRYTLCDVMDSVKSFPKTFLIGAEYDQIYPSTLACYKALKEKSFDCVLKTYPAAHAFMGFPFIWPQAKSFQQSHVDGTRDVLDFLAGREFQMGQASISQKTLYETVLGIAELSSLTCVLPLLFWLVAGRAGLGACAALHALLSMCGLFFFYRRHARFPEH
eukprot:TRINITY_DN26411_c0_g1_i1.p1 TRINITY_DN26411_c0_g1~~TRINITY_DN26411_c0_g1_i1.p1  ORF type:complete len:490 (-),score=59.33 TRINITY_DN26411_c0_g1_i1:253-1722(-)